MNPEDLKYTQEHEWARGDGNRGRCHGVRPGRPTWSTSPASGPRVEAGQPFGEVESTKSVSDLYAPVNGTIVERNETLESAPELVNSDPYGQGWLVVIEADDPADVDGLLSAQEYSNLTEAT